MNNTFGFAAVSAWPSERDSKQNKHPSTNCMGLFFFISMKELVVIGMVADPKPDDFIPLPNPHSTVIFIDAN